jgi:signal transduction histidine kinase
MRDAAGNVRRLALSSRGDALLAAALVAWAVVYLAVAPAPAGQRWRALIFVFPYAAAVAVRQRWPVLAAALAGAALLAVRPVGLHQVVESALAIPFLWTPFLLAYALGSGAGFAAGLGWALVLSACLQAENQVFNPILEVITLGPWLAGRVALSRRILTGQLAARNEELGAERELFALESVRYERARIARELHDIVAHCVTAMVVQASAGQRIAEADPDGVADALRSVSEAAAQAEAEIGKLVDLLGGQPAPAAADRLPMVSELARQASLTGLAVTCRFEGPCDRLPAEASAAGYRLVQEALTNALKHAPGAHVSITIREQDAAVEVAVVNAAPEDRASGLETSGSSYGLAGMRDRIRACGGTLTAGPTYAGGWHVSALLPVTQQVASAATTAPRAAP